MRSSALVGHGVGHARATRVHPFPSLSPCPPPSSAFLRAALVMCMHTCMCTHTHTREMCMHTCTCTHAHTRDVHAYVHVHAHDHVQHALLPTRKHSRATVALRMQLRLCACNCGSAHATVAYLAGQ